MQKLEDFKLFNSAYFYHTKGTKNVVISLKKNKKRKLGEYITPQGIYVCQTHSNESDSKTLAENFLCLPSVTIGVKQNNCDFFSELNKDDLIVCMPHVTSSLREALRISR